MHDFHFVINQKMKSQITETHAYTQTGSLSGCIKSILALLLPVARREHEWGEQRKSEYLFVKAKDDDKLADIHVFLPKSGYRRLKMLHHDLDFFSIAQLVRFLIAVYLELFRQYGDDIEIELNKLFSQWEQEERQLKRESRNKIRQLLLFVRNSLSKYPIITIYDRDCSPFWVLRL